MEAYQYCILILCYWEAFRFGLSASDDCEAAYVVGSRNSQHSAAVICNHLPSKSTPGSSIGGGVGVKMWSQVVEYSGTRIRRRSVV